MNCKGCDRNISGNDYKKVADWIFCTDCFNDLMNPSEQKTEDPKNLQQAHLKTDDQENEKRSSTCKICNADFGKEKIKRLGIWKLCDSCYIDLTFRPEVKITNEIVSENDQVDLEDNTTASADRLQTKTNQTVSCNNCDRIILQVASKENDGNYFCPDCFYKKTSESSVLPYPEIPDKFGSSDLCMCCDKNLKDTPICIEENYIICKTCYGTDRDLALGIAKKWYR